MTNADEIEVTEAMLDAGDEEFYFTDDGGHLSDWARREALIRIFRAMTRASARQVERRSEVP